MNELAPLVQAIEQRRKLGLSSIEIVREVYKSYSLSNVWKELYPEALEYHKELVPLIEAIETLKQENRIPWRSYSDLFDLIHAALAQANIYFSISNGSYTITNMKVI